MATALPALHRRRQWPPQSSSRNRTASVLRRARGSSRAPARRSECCVRATHTEAYRMLMCSPGGSSGRSLQIT
eukprot:6837675-Prymnesium_polylepis.1